MPDERENRSVSQQQHRILIIGCGSIGERHVRCYRATGRVSLGICEADDATRHRVQQTYSVSDSYASTQDALRVPWDAVLVATPAHTHVPIALEAARCGCHLIIEKPLATSLDGVDELQNLVARRGLTAAVSYQLRAHPLVRRLRESMQSGRWGAPLQVCGVSGQRFALYRPAYADTYFARHETGGGAIQDAITHLLNMAEWCAGPITSVFSDACHRQLPGVDVEDTVHLIARHGDIPAVYSLNMYQHPNESTLTVVCEEATVRFELHRHRLGWMSEPDGTWEWEEHRFADRDAWYIRNAETMLDVLEGRLPPPCSLSEAAQTLKVSLAALKSARSGTQQKITA